MKTSQDITRNCFSLSVEPGKPRVLAAALCALALTGVALSPAAAAVTVPSHDQKPLLLAAAEQTPSSQSRHRNLSPGTYKATKLIGREIKNTRGESIGEITDLALSPADGSVEYAVLSFGGIMGLGDKLFAVPLKAFEPGRKDDELVLNVSEQQLKSMQGFDSDHWPARAGKWPGVAAPAESHTSAMSGVDRMNAGASASAGSLTKASKYIGREVKNLDGKEIGEVEDLAIDLRAARINYAVIEHGGLLGVGEKLVAVPTRDLSQGRERDELVLQASAGALKQAKGFNDDNWPVTVSSLSGTPGQGTARQSMAAHGTGAGSAQQQFTQLDRNGDGYVSKSEANQSPMLKKEYNSLDKNRDGKLDKVEFARFEVMERRDTSGKPDMSTQPQSKPVTDPVGSTSGKGTQSTPAPQ